ncbi:unnamed protein product, partial [Mesorhabditis spiculigera]
MNEKLDWEGKITDEHRYGAIKKTVEEEAERRRKAEEGEALNEEEKRLIEEEKRCSEEEKRRIQEENKRVNDSEPTEPDELEKAMTAQLSRMVDSHGAGIGEAHVDIAVEPSGERFLTSAKDGSIWIWKPSVFSGDAEVTHQEIANRPRSTHRRKTHREQVRLGRRAAKPLLIPVGINAIDVSNTYIAAIGSDCTMKKAPLDQAASYEKIEFGNQPLSLAIDPTEKYIAVSFTEGSVEIYPTSGTERVAVFDKLFKSFGDIDPHKNRAQLKWSPDGEHLYMPAWDGIRVADVSNWECQRTRFNKSKDFEEEFSALALSEDGAYLAAGTLFGTICVWHTTSGKLISTHDYRNNNKMTAVCALAFLHNGKDLCIADIKQGVSLWYGAVDRKADVKDKPSSNFVIDEAMDDDVDKEFQRKRIRDDEQTAIDQTGGIKFLYHFK